MGINRFKISYTYDPLNRLSSVAVDGEKERYYGYDRAGNLTRISPDTPEKPSEPDLGKGTGEAELANRKEPASRKKPATGRDTGGPEPAARDERFAALEKKYELLNMEAQAGSISLEEFQQEVNRLQFQDAAGTWWQLRYDGAWLKWDGAAWVEGKPVS